MGILPVSFNRVANIVFTRFPETEYQFVNQIVHELKVRNLSNVGDVNDPLTGFTGHIVKSSVHDFDGSSNHEVSSDSYSLVTFHGLAFLDFVLTPV